MLVGGVSVSFALTGSVLFHINSSSIIKNFGSILKNCGMNNKLVITSRQWCYILCICCTLTLALASRP